VTATLNDLNATDTITQATSTTGSATVKVTAADGSTNQTYTVNFSVGSATVLAVGIVLPVPTVSVVDGTTLVDVGLPTSVPVALSNGSTQMLPVTWDGSSYNPTTPGTYTFTGTLTLPAGVINPNNKTATVKVVVTPVATATTISTLAINGVTAPVTTATPVATIADNGQYTGTVTWAPTDNPFIASTTYAATITLTPDSGYTLTGVAANSFTVTGATTTNAADSGVVTAVFPTTN
jgi:hypothetical protein